MPHVKLEYSANIKQDIHFNDLFAGICNELHRCAGVKIDNMKCRAYQADNFYIANGDENNAFVALEVKMFLMDRNAVLPELGKLLLEHLKQIFLESKQHLNLQITVNFESLHQPQYFKYA